MISIMDDGLHCDRCDARFNDERKALVHLSVAHCITRLSSNPAIYELEVGGNGKVLACIVEHLTKEHHPKTIQLIPMAYRASSPVHVLITVVAICV